VDPDVVGRVLPVSQRATVLALLSDLVDVLLDVRSGVVADWCGPDGTYYLEARMPGGRPCDVSVAAGGRVFVTLHLAAV
jgi:hypothetical protein